MTPDLQKVGSARAALAYVPFAMRTHRLSSRGAPFACDCVRIVFVRGGSAFLRVAHKDRSVALGDAVLIAANTVFGAVPEGRAVATTVCLDTDYALDQFFWQHSDVLADRHAARGFAETILANPVQVIRLGQARLESLATPLDELVRLSELGHRRADFFRMQALLFTVMHALVPHIKTLPVPTPRVSRAHAIPALPRWRRFVAIRPEVREVEAAMRADIARPWPLTALGGIAYLSGSQVSRVFVQTYGKTPLAYLSMLRVEEMTKLLRETELSTHAVGRRVGWSSREHAARVFRRYVGVTPAQYRRTGPPTAVPHTVGSDAHLHGEAPPMFTAKEPQP